MNKIKNCKNFLYAMYLYVDDKSVLQYVLTILNALVQILVRKYKV